MLEGQVILVTDACHFVGLPAARELAAQGAKVACHDPSFADDEARAGFEAEHPDFVAAGGQEATSLVAEVSARLGPIDVLVSNDSFPAIKAPIEHASLTDFRAGLEAMTVRPFALAGALVPHMKARRAGKLIFVTSATPFRGLPNFSMYVAARGATNALAVSLAQELARDNIQVNALAPNYVQSPTYYPPEIMADEKMRARIVRHVPLGRLGTPEEIAKTIAFLASPGADFITGQVIPFAGGWA